MSDTHPFETTLRISRQYKHHHADTLLSYHATLEDLLSSSIAGSHRLVAKTRTERGVERLGVEAGPLNKALRSSFAATEQWTFEAVVRDGVIFDNETGGGRIGGFDIARFDEAANLATLWSLCHGRRALTNGESEWQRALDVRPTLRPIAEELAKDWTPGEDAYIERSTPTILGEIQFGNWALGYRDVLKALAAQTQVDVDLFVYVVADGDLARMISSSTVNYAWFLKNLIQPFSNVLTIPTWVVGIDFAPGTTPTLDSLTAPRTTLVAQ